MGRPGDAPDPRGRLRRQRGASLLECLITMILVVLVVSAAMQGTLAMTRSSGFGERRVDLYARVDAAMQSLSGELRLTDTFGSDPVTGAPYVTVTGTAGDETIAFRRVLDFAQQDAEVVAVWSTPIEYLLSNGQLVRRQDGAERVLLRNARSLDFDVDALGRIRLVLEVGMPGGPAADGLERRDVVISPFQGL